MKFLFDLFPVLLFFAVFTVAKRSPEKAAVLADTFLSSFVSSSGMPADSAPMLLATAAAIVVTFLQVGYLTARRQKVEPVLWVSLVIITLFGGATIYFASETFIMLKPTILYWLFSLVLLFSLFLFRRNLIRLMLEKQLRLPEPVWIRLNFMWAGFFFLMGFINLFVAFFGGFATSTWVNFKLFGGLGLMLLFVIAQSLYLARYARDAEL